MDAQYKTIGSHILSCLAVSDKCRCILRWLRTVSPMQIHDNIERTIPAVVGYNNHSCVFIDSYLVYSSYKIIRSILIKSQFCNSR